MKSIYFEYFFSSISDFRVYILISFLQPINLVYNYATGENDHSHNSQLCNATNLCLYRVHTDKIALHSTIGYIKCAKVPTNIETASNASLKL